MHGCYIWYLTFLSLKIIISNINNHIINCLKKIHRLLLFYYKFDFKVSMCLGKNEGKEKYTTEKVKKIKKEEKKRRKEGIKKARQNRRNKERTKERKTVTRNLSYSQSFQDSPEQWIKYFISGQIFVNPTSHWEIFKLLCEKLFRYSYEIHQIQSYKLQK